MSKDLNSDRSAQKAEDLLWQRIADLFGDATAAFASEGEVAHAAEATGGCPEPGVWLDLAEDAMGRAGAPGPAQINTLLAHAAQCSACAARLLLVQGLLREPTPAEEAEFAALDLASPGGRRELAARLARTPHEPVRVRRSPRIVLWAGAGLAASLIVAAAAGLWWRQANAPERLLAEAYTSSRTFDFRVPGASYSALAPEKHLRGGAEDREPAQLLDARARIARELEHEPHDPHWLQLQARAQVMDEQFDAAIGTLDRLLEAGPVTPILLTDDAMAYFQRGNGNGSESDRATALEYLRRADELAPSDPVVLFNEAIAMEDRGQVMNAVETWNRYLRFERDAAWLAEGKRRLQSLEEKLKRLKTHQGRMEEHLSRPAGRQDLAGSAEALSAVDEELSGSARAKSTEGRFPSFG